MSAYPRIQHLGPPGHIENGGKAEWNPFQAGLLKACFLPHVDLVVANTAVRTGKTGCQAAFHRYMAKKHPRVRGIWLVESYKWFKRAGLPVCRQLFGHEANWHGTNHTWTWPAFGDSQVVICTYKDLQSMQGVTAGWGSIDEYQNIGSDAHNELEQRISDARAKPCILITGLPVFASWADTLAEDSGGVSLSVAEKDVTKNCVHFSEIPTAINTRNVHSLYVERLRKRLSPEEFDRRIRGLKPKPEGTVCRNWVATTIGGNLVEDWEYNSAAPVWLAFDPGVRRNAAVIGQHCLEGDVMFDEANLDDTSTEATCVHLRRKYVGMRLRHREPNKIPIRVIYVDPAGASPETSDNTTDIKVLRRHFPGASIKYTYNKQLRSRVVGTRALKSRIMSADGERHLFMTKEMWDKGLRNKREGRGYRQGKRGRSTAFTIARLKWAADALGKVLHDVPETCPIDGHIFDALRYMVVNKYGAPEAEQFEAT